MDSYTAGHLTLSLAFLAVSTKTPARDPCGQQLYMELGASWQQRKMRRPAV